jgi:AcrR family transcriptional regulator
VTETTAPAPRRRERMPRSARRAQLLDAALEVFVAKGYHATGMDDIADRAGVSKPVLYQHFPGKLELYLALLDTSCDAVVDAVAAALEATDDNKERVAATVDAFYTYVANDKAAFRLVFESDLTQEPAVRERVERVITDSAALITQVIRDDTGLPDEESELLAVSRASDGCRYGPPHEADFAGWLQSISPAAAARQQHHRCPRPGGSVEVRIAVQNASRELVVESAQSSEEIAQAVRDALTSPDGLLVLTDDRGRKVVVPADRLAFVDIGEESMRKVGFGSR